MEVFVRGIPERATENQLSKCFRPILAELGILDWDCQKRKGKSFGFLIFLKVEDARSSWIVTGRSATAGAMATSQRVGRISCSMGLHFPAPEAQNPLTNGH